MIDDAEMRRQIVAGLISQGVKAPEAHQAADVAFHTVRSVDELVSRLCQPLEGAAWLNAVLLIWQLLPKLADAKFEWLQQEASSFGIERRSFMVGATQ